MTFDVPLLRRHYQSGIALDTNVFLLWVVGGFDIALIARHPRTRAFLEEDFDLLRRIISPFRRILSTPNVLTEWSIWRCSPGSPVSGHPYVVGSPT